MEKMYRCRVTTEVGDFYLAGPDKNISSDKNDGEVKSLMDWLEHIARNDLAAIRADATPMGLVAAKQRKLHFDPVEEREESRH